jgi:hypothetical protein
MNARKEKELMMGKVAKMVLFFYILSMFQPVMPVVMDVIAHTFYEQQHIMMVHEVHGKFHIHSELANSLHQSDKEKSNDLRYEVTEYVHVMPAIFKSQLHTLYTGSMYLSYSCFYPITYRDIDVPPPKTA